MQPDHETHPAQPPLTCPACDAPLDRQRFEVVNLKFEQNITSAVQIERRELKAQFEREAAAARKAAQDGAAEQIAIVRRDTDATVKRAEEDRDVAKKSADEAVRAAAAERDRAVNVGVTAARAKWEEEQRAVREKLDAEARVRELALNEKVLALTRQDESHKTSIQELQAQSRETAERHQEVVRRLEADKTTAVNTARAADQAKHSESLAVVAAELKAAKEREAAAVATATEATRAVEARVEEAVKIAETKTREVLDADFKRQRMELVVETARDKEKLTAKLSDVQRQLADRTPNEIGDGAELDLYEVLRAEFEEDRITRVPKGTEGADIHIEVREHGQVVGLIIVDSKDRKDWKTSYATKLRQDQINAKADHAILSTTVFPKGCKELHRESGVMVASPRRVVAIVDLMRDDVINAYKLRATHGQRAGRKEALYEYITSVEYDQKMDEIERTNNEMLDLDVEETKQHKKVWEKRGRLLKQQERSITGLRVEVTAIVTSNVVSMDSKK